MAQEKMKRKLKFRWNLSQVLFSKSISCCTEAFFLLNLYKHWVERMPRPSLCTSKTTEVSDFFTPGQRKFSQVPSCSFKLGAGFIYLLGWLYCCTSKRSKQSPLHHFQYSLFAWFIFTAPIKCVWSEISNKALWNSWLYPEENNPVIFFLVFAFIYAIITSVSEPHDLFLFLEKDDLVMSNHINLTRVWAQSSPVQNNVIFNSFFHKNKTPDCACRIPYSPGISNLNNFGLWLLITCFSACSGTLSYANKSHHFYFELHGATTFV